MLQPNPQAITSWPIPGDVPPLEAIITAQAATISRQFALLHDYQDILDEAQQATTATATGTSTGTTTLTLTAVSGNVMVGAAVTGAGVPASTTITSQQSGTAAGNGIYITNQATTLTNAALTFTTTPTTWPIPTDAPTLNLIVQSQTSVIRNQTSLIQQYQDLLTTSQTAPPSSGP